MKYIRSEVALPQALPSTPYDVNLDTDNAESILRLVVRASGLNLRQITTLGTPRGTDLDTIKDWTVGLLRECIAAIAGQVDQRAADLLAKAIEEVRREVHATRYTLTKAEGKVSAMQQEQQLPDPDSLDLPLRYEGHLSRELRHALHELQALQSMRLGGTAPLARVSVTGGGETVKCRATPQLRIWICACRLLPWSPLQTTRWKD